MANRLWVGLQIGHIYLYPYTLTQKGGVSVRVICKWMSFYSHGLVTPSPHPPACTAIVAVTRRVHSSRPRITAPSPCRATPVDCSTATVTLGRACCKRPPLAARSYFPLGFHPRVEASWKMYAETGTLFSRAIDSYIFHDASSPRPGPNTPLQRIQWLKPRAGARRLHPTTFQKRNAPLLPSRY
jgi:hypothetical protein